MWASAQLAVARHARGPLLSPCRLRSRARLAPEVAERVSAWFTATPAAPDEAVLRSYRALERDTARLFAVVRDELGVRVRYTRAEAYGSAAELCAELRGRRTMTLTTGDQLHPLLGGTLDQLRVVHDVFGHAALGLGFDLQGRVRDLAAVPGPVLGRGASGRVLRARRRGHGLRHDRRKARAACRRATGGASVQRGGLQLPA